MQDRLRIGRLKLALALLACVVVAGIVVRLSRPPQAELVTRQLSAVMGTSGELKVFVPVSDAGSAGEVFSAAEAAIRDVEARMSAKLADSELGRLNAARGGREIQLSAEILELLRTSSRMAEATNGAFDVTCRPILLAWQRAGREAAPPSDDELALALAASGWHNFELLDGGIRKLSGEASMDLGGIAKGYGIDRAVSAMIRRGAADGLVDVGGDVRCFGDRQGRGWTIGVQDPFVEGLIATIGLSDAAVCTSGNYRRFVEIDGKRYSHIVDPRTGRPAEMTPSVTVVAPTATVADGWATALGVLGEKGLSLLNPNEGLEAMMVLGGPDDCEIVVTPGFDKLFVQRPQAGIRVYRGHRLQADEPAGGKAQH